MKFIIIYVYLIFLLYYRCLATPSCSTNANCPPYQQCTTTGYVTSCNYSNFCVCQTGILNIVDGVGCPNLFTCQILPCIPQGNCQYDGNM